MGRKALVWTVVLACSTLVAPAQGAVTLDLALPRSGIFHLDASTPAAPPIFIRRIRTADSDELVKTFDLPATGQGITDFTLSVDPHAYNDTIAGHTPIPLSAAVVKAPQDLDAGNWAMAISVYDGPLLVFFFQYRLAGASATVMDSTLATAAVDAGLWTGINDYFEFPAAHAGVSQLGTTQSGPSSFISFAIPEPQACELFHPH